MLDRLPRYIDPLHLADKHSEVEGELSLKDFGRLSDMLFDTDGNVVIDLFFSREGRLAKIEGKIEANLQLICQNCLQAVECPVQTEVRLGVISSLEQINRLPEGFEPLLIEDEKIPLLDLVEEELLLFLPQYPKHPEFCRLLEAGDRQPEKAETNRKQRPDNPFSILTHLINNPESPDGSTKK